jgi:excisionase family DNA binding protein
VADAPKVGRSVSIECAAMLLHVSKRTVYHRIRAGKLQTIRTIGGSQRVTVDSMARMAFGDLEAAAQPTPAPAAPEEGLAD